MPLLKTHKRAESSSENRAVKIVKSGRAFRSLSIQSRTTRHFAGWVLDACLAFQAKSKAPEPVVIGQKLRQFVAARDLDFWKTCHAFCCWHGSSSIVHTYKMLIWWVRFTCMSSYSNGEWSRDVPVNSYISFRLSLEDLWEECIQSPGTMVILTPRYTPHVWPPSYMFILYQRCI